MEHTDLPEEPPHCADPGHEMVEGAIGVARHLINLTGSEASVVASGFLQRARSSGDEGLQSSWLMVLMAIRTTSEVARVIRSWDR